MEIFDLSNIPSSSYSTVGGKAKGLHALSMAGLRIAPGFVVTDISSEEDIDKAADFYAESALSRVAVRSSATAEDGAEFSNAGQYSSFLNIMGREEVKNAINKCICSLNNNTATSYAANFRLEDNSKMSVIIQEMIDARKAGVCFTCDPVTGSNNILIEAVPGPGELLVSGSTPGKQYRLPARSQVPEKEKFPDDDGLLDASELIKIRDDVEAASSFMNTSLDTEWAIDSEGQLFWLQARPITTLDEPAMNEMDTCLDLKDDIITKCNISEMLPGAVTPLSISTSVDAIDYGMRRMFVKAGAYNEMEDIPPTSCALSVCNHLFINLGSIYRMADCVLGASRDSAELSICGKILTDIPKPRKKKINFFIQLNNGRRYFQLLLLKDKARKQIQKLAESFVMENKENPAELYSEIDKNLQTLKEAFWLHYITSGHSGAMASALFLILNADFNDNEKTRSVIASLLESIDEIESVDILRSLRKLARAILTDDPSAASYDGKELIEYITKSSGETKKAYDYFISRHGHRAIREAEVRSKAWSRDKEGFANYLKAVIASGGEEGSKSTGVEHNIKDILEKSKGIKKIILKYIIKQARIGVKNREFSKSMCIKVLEQFKIAYANLAGQLVWERILPDEDLVYFLKHDEIGLLLREKQSTLIKKALARKRLLNQQQTLKFQDFCIGKPKPVILEAEKAEEGKILNGSPASRGFSKGMARVVKTIEDANKLKKGEIMVAAFTDIGWSPYYCLLGALVTEVGSVLSHGVVVAREYALPLVVNLEGATQLIQTGDMVAVDGTAGTVTILKSDKGI